MLIILLKTPNKPITIMEAMQQRKTQLYTIPTVSKLCAFGRTPIVETAP